MINNIIKLIQNKIGLRLRIYIILAALVSITLLGGLTMVWYTYRAEALFTSIIEQNIETYQATQDLETALINQKGFVSYYFIDGNPDWLRQLEKYRVIFRMRLNKARSLSKEDAQRQIIEMIDSEYSLYLALKDRVISYYKAGNRKLGANLHKQVRYHFYKILNLCEKNKVLQMQIISIAKKNSYAEAKKLRIVAASAMFIEFILGIIITFILIRNVLDPIRSLSLKTYKEDKSKKSGNEIKALSRGVRGLIEDMDLSHQELKKSRKHLVQSEKMVIVGKLAAEMAHSIRNPFTSIQMRLFSLNRTLGLTAEQNDDFEVISQEIHRIDTIVQHFLEFSRAPKLARQKISPSEVIDQAVTLLEHRLKSYNVKINIIRKQPLPKIYADPEQLKEVFVNIIINACEAMEHNGLICIFEEEAFARPLGKVAILRLNDNGPGIPDSSNDTIFQPFYTTKEEGTGLGLSIASRIIDEHGGWLEVKSIKGEGATFIIMLPLTGTEHEYDSNN